jgi:preprotein translocase subunit SecE
VNFATFIMILVMATAFVAIIWSRDRWDWPTDYQLMIMAVVFTSFAAIMFFKCGGWTCSLGG